MAVSDSKKSYGWNGDMVKHSLDRLDFKKSKCGITKPAQHGLFNNSRSSLTEMTLFLP